VPHTANALFPVFCYSFSRLSRWDVAYLGNIFGRASPENAVAKDFVFHFNQNIHRLSSPFRAQPGAPGDGAKSRRA
jgi:hypothetical protein